MPAPPIGGLLVNILSVMPSRSVLYFVILCSLNCIFSPCQGPECCSEYSISFHYIAPKAMYLMEFFVYHLRPYGLRLMSNHLTQKLSREEFEINASGSSDIRPTESDSRPQEQRPYQMNWKSFPGSRPPWFNVFASSSASPQPLLPEKSPLMKFRHVTELLFISTVTNGCGNVHVVFQSSKKSDIDARVGLAALSTSQLTILQDKP